MTEKKSVRERLLDAADELMFVAGAVGTPVDALLKRAGASPTSLYSQFGNKDGLIAAALERRLAEWTASWEAALQQAETDEERALSVFEALRIYQRDRLTERWCAFSGTAASMMDPSPAVADILLRETELLRERLLEHARPIAGDAAETLARGLMITYNGTLTMMLRQPWEDAINEGESVARQLVRDASCEASRRARQD